MSKVVEPIIFYGKPESLTNAEIRQKISDLSRRIYYLKKYGLDLIPPKRNYNRKERDLLMKKEKNDIIIKFD
jgi:hypothetical protein|tara:strand:- start:130 stop:345 length:216 start_codon:yes stop_codon:yes gene_type:complete